MFGRVAHRYDLANHLLSFNIDRLLARAHRAPRAPRSGASGRARARYLLRHRRPLVLALRRARGPVLGSDFCHPMLVAARRKDRATGCARPLFEADALRCPCATARST